MADRKGALEDLAMKQFDGVYCGTRVVVTGHTGFKGSWLTTWLSQLGAEIGGISLHPKTAPSHWQELGLEIDDYRIDIGDAEKVTEVLQGFKPKIVFHLAAQSLVRRSYQAPVYTWATNVMGTAHVLEACRSVESVKAVVVVTTDKVYADKIGGAGYRESDRLGGVDPYSASKAACELLIDSYRHAFYHSTDNILVASARAGNVLAGGDWSEDRLIPDVIRSITQKSVLEIRSPDAIRPWQHVLDCLSGYLLLAQKLFEGNSQFAESWNFGPAPQSNCSVTEILTRIQAHCPELKWVVSADTHLHETTKLCLDYSKAKARLEWQPVWDLNHSLDVTAYWYNEFHERGKLMTHAQILDYVQDAYTAGACWVQA